MGGQREQEVAGLALHGGDEAEQRRRGAEQAGRRKGKRDQFAISEMSGTLL